MNQIFAKINPELPNNKSYTLTSQSLVYSPCTNYKLCIMGFKIFVSKRVNFIEKYYSGI